MYLGLIVSFRLGKRKITEENIKAVLKRQAPKIDPKGIKAVYEESLDPATIAVTISVEPLANAKNVTPAKLGEISYLIYDY
jgi:hypothetical protein